MTPLIMGLLSWGPSLIRAAGSLIGGKTSEAANSVADLVDQVKGLPSDVAQQKLSAELAKLPPETLLEFEKVKVRLAEIEKEREANQLAAQTAQQKEIQETARVEAVSTDIFVRRTRPTLARRSFTYSIVYAFVTVVLFPLIAFGVRLLNPGIDVPALPTFQEWAFAAIASPCLSYIGARSFDYFSNRGKS